MKEFLETAVEAARMAGRIMMDNLDRPKKVSLKGVADLVTEIDLKCEREIVSLITKRHPGHSILAEEGGETRPGADHLWIIDPVDGTTNYAHGFRRFAVCVALAINGKAAAGAVYSPVLDEMFTAVRGGGAYLNGERIRVSEVDRVEDALIGTGFAYDRGERLGMDLELYVRLLPKAQSVRRSGCAGLDLCDVACGRYDGFWELNLSPWDVAAGTLIIEEAGGKWTGVSGQEVDLFARQCLATNGKIHREMQAMLGGMAQER